MSTTIISVILALVAGGAIIAMMMPDEKATLADRIALASSTWHEQADEQRKMRQREREDQLYGFAAKLIDQLRLSRWLGVENIQAKLAAAGLREKKDETFYLLTKIGYPLGFLALSAMWIYWLELLPADPMWEIGMAIFSVVGGLRLPDTRINRMIEARKQAIKDDWPNTLDLLCIATRAGMTFDIALINVSRRLERLSPVLWEELQFLQGQLAIAAERRDAYAAFSARNPMESIKSFATILTQSEKSGTSISDALTTLAEEARLIRIREAEARAAQISAKLSLPVVLCLLPALLAIVIGPAAVSYFTR